MNSDSCNIRCKDTNLKAIHNDDADWSDDHELQYPMQRYKFESNSQLEKWKRNNSPVAISDAKIQI